MGKHVAHDNNRDTIGKSLALTQNMMHRSAKVTWYCSAFVPSRAGRRRGVFS